MAQDKFGRLIESSWAQEQREFCVEFPEAKDAVTNFLLWGPGSRLV
jgi:hypothetical protein